ncbi:acetyltransferase [Chitinophaga oryzae]|uniref:Acetyltransferase n=1 Tax=Chitinophaga oryzae TaxID=2725414 RepID=A0ABX6LKX3_9BACT|nr:acetyltransferase [Chitinophaga oryzae]QJB40653.1 acetyltransferase [Chitinophaga oryzae]
MQRKNIVIVGTSGHGFVVMEILQLMQEYNIVGFIDSFKPKNTPCIDHLTVLGHENDIPTLTATYDIYGGIVAIGDNTDRANMVSRIKAVAPGFKFVNACHPSSVVSPRAIIGEGNVLCANVVINTNTTIGNFCIVNTASSIDHDNQIMDFTSIAPGVTTGGNVNIGANTAIGIGAVIKHRINIGEQCVVGAGAVVLSDVSPRSVWYGTPARKIRDRQPGDKYL